jgi:uncharacterized Zn ribbon protein
MVAKQGTAVRNIRLDHKMPNSLKVVDRDLVVITIREEKKI